MKDSTLILSVLLLVGVDVIILLVYVIVEGTKGTLSAKQVPHAERPTRTEGVRHTILFLNKLIASFNRILA